VHLQPAGRASHCTDLEWLFNDLPWSGPETALMLDLHGYLANVVRTRDPNSGAKWMQYLCRYNQAF
jgi:hypothetical protein